MILSKVSFGVLIAIGGWAYLLGFVGVDTGYGNQVVNLHSLTIANNVILLGYAICIWGVLEAGFRSLSGGKPLNYGTSLTEQARTNHQKPEGTSAQASESASKEEITARKKELSASLSKMKQ